ncbi:hypothetical protein BX666DRAFT_1248111 [Dichotomocladium elegans]|nr:hypothetical protein BX666DRAFT_1248111 [Dichotomocladium elegans]
MSSHTPMHHSSLSSHTRPPKRPSPLRTYDSSPVIIPTRTSSLHHQLNQQSPSLGISKYGGIEYLRSYSATSLNALLSDLDRQREQCERDRPNLNTSPVTTSAEKNKKQSITFPRIFSRRTVMRYCSKTRLSSICGFRPSSGKEQTEVTQGASSNQKKKEQGSSNSEDVVRPCTAGSAFQSSRTEKPAIHPDQLEHQIHEVGSRVKIEQTFVDVKPSRASIELVDHPSSSSLPRSADEISKQQQQKSVKLGLDFYQQKKLEKATAAFRDAAATQCPIGQLLYGLALYYRWDEEQALALIKIAAHGNDWSMDLKNISNTSRVELALAIYELGIVFHTGWGCERDEHTTNFLFDMAADLFDSGSTSLQTPQSKQKGRFSMGWHYQQSTNPSYFDGNYSSHLQRRRSL